MGIWFAADVRAFANMLVFPTLSSGKEVRSVQQIATSVGRKKLAETNLSADAECIILCWRSFLMRGLHTAVTLKRSVT